MNLKRILFCLTAFAAAIATSVPCAARRPVGLRPAAALLEHPERHVVGAGRQLRPLRGVGEGVRRRRLRVVRGAVDLPFGHGRQDAGSRPLSGRQLGRTGGALRPQVLVRGRSPRQFPAGDYLEIPDRERRADRGRGARQRGDARRGVGPHREERSHGQYRDAASVAAGLRLPGDRRGGEPRRARGRPLPPHGDRVYLPAYDRHRSPRRRRALGDAGRQQLVVAARQLVLQMSGGRSAGC